MDVLSIAKLAPGGQRYYLEQAGGLVEHRRSVASGVEDYYLGGPEATGTWTGAAARELGIDRLDVTEDALDRSLSAADPRTGEPLMGPITRSRVPGFDLTFSVPKSASLLWALGDDRTREAVWRAQRAAVADALAYLDAEACWGRLGAGGRAGAFQGSGLLAAAFEHRASRAGDPHVHTHVLVANRVERPDGSFAALDGRLLYAEAKTAGYVHEAAFRHELTRELGVTWSGPQRGMAEVEGIAPEVLRAFSRRRREIEAYTQARGDGSRSARQVAAYRTRDAKDYAVTPERLAPEWRLRAERLGLGRDDVERLLETARRRPLELPMQPRVSIARLVEHVAHFDRRAVVQAAAEAASQGARLDRLTAAVDSAIATEEILPLLDPSARRDQFLRLRDGRTVSAASYRRRYSTRSMLVTEREVLELADAGTTRDWGRATAASVSDVIATRPSLGRDQVAMVRRLCEDGDAVQVVVGRAGAGKTYALRAAVAAWRRSGRPVQGAAVARQAARNLERHAGMPATSVASLLHERVEIPRQGVLVIDEAGMLATRDLHSLMRHCLDRETKLVLVGDDRQLPEIDAGGAFGALVRRLPVIELTGDRRQRAAARRVLLEQLRDGDTRPVLAALHDSGDLQFVPSYDAAIETVVAQYVDAVSRGEDSLMLAVRRREVDALNARARDTLAQRGVLGEATILVDALELADGDRVLLRVNDDRLDVQNGTRGVVVDIDPCRHLVEVATSDARSVRLDSRYFRQRASDGGPALVYGYASTGHAAQGSTVDSTFVLGSDAMYREWLYVVLTRSRARTTLTVPDDALPSGRRTCDSIGGLAELVSRSQRQTMAVELGEAGDVTALLRRELGARPIDAAGALRWDRALKAVEAYRSLDRDRGDDTLLGPRPAESGARLHWTAASGAVERARRGHAQDLGREL